MASNSKDWTIKPMTNPEKIEMISGCLGIPPEDVSKWDQETIDMEVFRLNEDPDNI